MTLELNTLLNGISGNDSFHDAVRSVQLLRSLFRRYVYYLFTLDNLLRHLETHRCCHRNLWGPKYEVRSFPFPRIATVESNLVWSFYV